MRLNRTSGAATLGRTARERELQIYYDSDNYGDEAAMILDFLRGVFGD